jgi:hypothetical protein
MIAPHVERRTLSLTVLVSVLAALVSILIAGAAQATVVSVLPGGTWSVLPSATAGGTEAIVTGPAKPPVGRMGGGATRSRFRDRRPGDRLFGSSLVLAARRRVDFEHEI